MQKFKYFGMFVCPLANKMFMFDTSKILFYGHLPRFMFNQ